MANVVLTILSMTIGFFFLFVGTMKISSMISDEGYREMVKPVFIAHLNRSKTTRLNENDCKKLV